MCLIAYQRRGVYNAQLHPLVIAGKLTEDEVFLEFISHFKDVQRTGKIGRDVNSNTDTRPYHSRNGMITTLQ
jgi:hypothetical protein